MAEVRAAHVLVKHTQSRNPISRRTGKEITISPEQAMVEIRAIEAQIQQQGLPDSFYSLAQVRSDCSSFNRGGDLGFFSRGTMQKPFEDAAFNLQPGQMSGVVSTDSGLHLIYRME